MGLNDTLEQLEAARAECARLEAALEAAEQERDELRASLTELQPTSAVWRANRAAEDAKREADALAAVIEQVREYGEKMRDAHGMSWCSMHGRDVLRLLVPAVSLAEHDAQVLEAAEARIRHKQHAESVRRMLRGEAARLREEAGQ